MNGTNSIELYLVNETRCYALVRGELLAIGGLNADGSIFRGDQMYANADLKKLDEYLGWTGGWDYSHALDTARGLLSQSATTAKRVASVDDILV